MDLLIRSALTLVVVLFGASAGFSVRAGAQSASGPDLTAAYLTNFARFTVWPPEALPAEARLVMCVRGSESVSDALDALTRSQTIAGHALSVRRVKPEDTLQECHLVYATNLDRDEAERLLRETGNRPILTVSDAADFTRKGGIAHFFVEKERLRFAVNPEAADRARLRISSKLLSLSTIVKAGRP